ncbi:MAG: alpha/beta hydrolase [Actinomycetota bacterium]|jgi:pimeloyl-ACP methyl ester carboxylesterase|nr:alpha/beta hydrolase [Actinomycetota bacterium]
MNKKNLRKYGKPPFSIALLHGGPGAPGEMAPVARELSSYWGVLEPLQTKSSIEEQVNELYYILAKNGDPPVTLIGWSWGAMLGFIFTAKYPRMVKKLILVGSAVFEQKYAEKIMKTRLNRLDKEERIEMQDLIENLNNHLIEDKEKNILISRFGKLLFKSDSYNPLPYKNEILEYRYHIYRYVWKEVENLRSSGKLLKMGKQISCPVVAIHGDYDPHPFQGVLKPLLRIIKNFHFIILEKCGHEPWIERMAKDRFYGAIKKELKF